MTRSTGVCAVDGCGPGVIYGRGWCRLHYARWWRTGDPSGLLRPVEKPRCAIEGCDRLSRSRSWCRLHYGRWLTTGDPLGVLPAPYTPPGPTHPSWRGNSVGYTTAHRRVGNLKGAASGHSCVDCGARASHWSYDHLDPEEIVPTSGKRSQTYSAKPEHYQARCVPCHRHFDDASRAQVSA